MSEAQIPTDWLERAATEHPAAIALRDGRGRELAYAELAARAGRVAGGIARRTGAGALCLLDLSPGLEHATAMHACMLAGRPFQTLRPGLADRERERIFAAAAHELAIDARTLAALAEAEPAPGAVRDPGRTLCRILSSGTSGEPKGIELTWANHYASARASAELLPLAPGDRWLCCLPLDHVGGLAILLRSVLAAATAVVHERFRVEAVAAALERVELVSLVPTQLARLLEAGAPLDRPRAILLGGAPAETDLLRAAAASGARLFVGYGLTEACSTVSVLAPGEPESKLGSAGRALPGIEVSSDGGRIRVRGEVVAPASADGDGWLQTGDLGRLDGEGYLWVEGRADDLIVSGGENVNPSEVEAALLEHPLVADAGVAGRPDPEWGSQVRAWVVAAGIGEPSEAELLEHCRSRLSGAKVPKRIELVAALPRSAGGKLRRRELG